jgi:hypothetical protein
MVACGYRALGCRQETARVEAMITGGGGVVGACRAMLSDAQCSQLGSLVFNKNLPTSTVRFVGCVSLHRCNY